MATKRLAGTYPPLPIPLNQEDLVGLKEPEFSLGQLVLFLVGDLVDGLDVVVVDLGTGAEDVVGWDMVVACEDFVTVVLVDLSSDLRVFAVASSSHLASQFPGAFHLLAFSFSRDSVVVDRIVVAVEGVVGIEETIVNVADWIAVMIFDVDVVVVVEEDFLTEIAVAVLMSMSVAVKKKMMDSERMREEPAILFLVRKQHDLR